MIRAVLPSAVVCAAFLAVVAIIDWFDRKGE